MPSSSHQSKRPYAGTHSQSHNQSTITSYFHSTTSGTPTPAQPPIRSLPQAPPPPSTPLLPASVQSNLLNVGMRVRKSVPEGYKTGTFSGFSLFSDNRTGSAPTRDPSPARRYGAPRKELTPFCGIMKVGGLAQQTYTADIEDDIPTEDDLPFLSSQGSMLSDVSTQAPATPSGHKRRFSSDDEEEEADFDLAMGRWTDDAPSPKSQPIARGVENRTLAQPRSRRTRTLPFQTRGDGREEMAVDFEDAEFLDYGAWAGEEVVMRDV